MALKAPTASLSFAAAPSVPFGRPLRTSFFNGGVGSLRVVQVPRSNNIRLRCGDLGARTNLFDQQARVVRMAVRIPASMATFNALEGQVRRMLLYSGRNFRQLSPFTPAVGSGLQASITDQKKNELSLDNVKIVVELRDEEKIQVRVDLTAEETQKAFDSVLTNLARTAPPIPGFRRMKGGKTSNVPKSFLLQMLGKDRVTKFLIQEIVSTTIGDFVKLEDLNVETQFKTMQSAEELESAFSPGSEFGFNATLDIAKPDSEEADNS